MTRLIGAVSSPFIWCSIKLLGVLLTTDVTVEASTEGAVFLTDRRLVLLFFGMMALVSLILVIATRGQLGYSGKAESGE